MYRITTTGVVREDGLHIPVDQSNVDFQEYQRWIDSGNTPLPIEAPSEPPLQDRIDAFVRQNSGGRIDNEMQLEASTASILALHLVLGGTEPQLEASNSAYRQAKQLRAAVANMRAQG